MSKTPLLGLVLDTGKGSLIYHKLPPVAQRTRHIKSLQSLGIETFLSSESIQKTSENYNVVLHHKEFMGSPGAGILSAHLFKPEVAWLVIACDFPFADINAIRDLISHRKGNGASIAYTHPDRTIEPLFAIWEPDTLIHFLGQFKMGNKSPRKALEDTGALTSIPENNRTLVNINSPQDQIYPDLHH